MGLALDGLISGNNTTELINQLMAVEGNQQTLLKQKQTAATSFITALQSLNTKVASLAQFAKTAATDDAWKAMATRSSATSVTASAGITAQPSAVTFSVDKLARAQATLVTLPTDGSGYPTQPPTITIARGDKLTTISPASGSLADITAAINAASDSGIKAVAVRVGNAGADGSEPQYKLQLTGDATGADAAFEVYLGDSAAVADLRAGNAAASATKLTGQDAIVLSAAGDAEITLWPGAVIGSGPDATTGLKLTSSTNTFGELLTGVSVTVSAVENTPVTITTTPDAAALKNVAAGIVTNLQTVLSEITSRTKSTESKASDGRTILTGGLFSGDSAIRLLQQNLQSLGSAPVDGVSPSDVGIIIGKDGTFTFDEAKFSAALAADPAKTQKIVQTIAERLQVAADTASNKDTGNLTQKITGQESSVKTMGDQITNWDYRLTLRRASLEKTYSALEVALGKMQSTQSWLTSQLASLPSWSS
ncbi:flagellar hook-associated protein 2 [Sanguibacter gelidistatuariae]|uniref:Flagellar hook-associated protein 2 n=1 Tax=Sanguibacter gelidistatuariae TaxID=1814289 RepID=A0A1G6PXG7_9MICO|nr:flagellar filament capping protein FliD [Sanguibacter gelidistatuariae]SDC84216.1 flagellar hook-associated protein 2 [Sanguibacter gelidistatuariae]